LRFQELGFGISGLGFRAEGLGCPSSDDEVKIDPKEILGSYVCPTVGRMSLLATWGMGLRVEG